MLCAFTGENLDNAEQNLWVSVTLLSSHGEWQKPRMKD